MKYTTFPAVIWCLIFLLFVMPPDQSAAQYPGYSKYIREVENSKRNKEKKWIDIYVDSPLYVGRINKVNIDSLNLDDLYKDDFNAFRATTIPNQFTIECRTPGEVQLSFRSKTTHRTTHIFHYKVMRLPDDKLKEEPVISIGNHIESRISLDFLRTQTEIKVSNGYLLKSSIVYFSGAGFQNVWVVAIKGAAIIQLDSLLTRCQTGSTITFDNNIIYRPGEKEFTIATKTFIISSISESNTEAQLNKAARELISMAENEFVAGTIFFSGEGFYNTISIPFNQSNSKKINDCLAVCKPGSVVTFDNCIYKTPEGKLSSPINKSIKL